MRQAVEAGWTCRALTRRPPPEREGVTWIAGSLDQPDSLAEMAAGADVVMHIAGVVNVPTRAAFEAGNATATANVVDAARNAGITRRSEEHTSELQSLMRISYAVFCLRKKQMIERSHPV